MEINRVRSAILATLLLSAQAFAAPVCPEHGGTEFPQALADANQTLDATNRASRFPDFTPMPRQIQRGCARLNHRIAFQFVVKRNDERIDGGNFYIERDPATGDVLIEQEGPPRNPHLIGFAEHSLADNQGLKVVVSANSYGENLRSQGPSSGGGAVPEEIRPCLEAALPTAGRKIFDQY